MSRREEFKSRMKELSSIKILLEKGIGNGRNNLK